MNAMLCITANSAPLFFSSLPWRPALGPQPNSPIDPCLPAGLARAGSFASNRSRHEHSSARHDHLGHDAAKVALHRPGVAAGHQGHADSQRQACRSALRTGLDFRAGHATQPRRPGAAVRRPGVELCTGQPVGQPHRPLPGKPGHRQGRRGGDLRREPSRVAGECAGGGQARRHLRHAQHGADRQCAGTQCEPGEAGGHDPRRRTAGCLFGDSRSGRHRRGAHLVRRRSGCGARANARRLHRPDGRQRRQRLGQPRAPRGSTSTIRAFISTPPAPPGCPRPAFSSTGAGCAPRPASA